MNEIGLQGYYRKIRKKMKKNISESYESKISGYQISQNFNTSSSLKIYLKYFQKQLSKKQNPNIGKYLLILF